VPRLPLYARLLASSWPQLAEPVRFAHTPQPLVRARARLRVEHGRNRIARLLAWVLRLPRAADDAEATLVVVSHEDGERWCRTFGDRRFDTRQHQTGPFEVAERIGILELRFRLGVDDGSLVFRQVHAAFVMGSIHFPLPLACAPVVDAREDAAGTRRLRIQVRLSVPAVGPVLTYQGTVDYEELPA
jgi:hypothetical protein